MSKSDSRELCAGACTCVSTRLSAKTSNQYGRSANGSFASLSFFGDSCSSFPVACSLRRCDTEPEDELEAAVFPEAWSASVLNDSCGSDVRDELPPEMVHNPGTTRGTKLFVLQIRVFPVGVNRGP